MVRQLIKIPSRILRSEKPYGLKISQSIIYVKEYFYIFFSTLKDIIKQRAQNCLKITTSQ